MRGERGGAGEILCVCNSYCMSSSVDSKDTGHTRQDTQGVVRTYGGGPVMPFKNKLIIVKLQLQQFHVSDIYIHVVFQSNPTLPFQQQLALLLPGARACRPDLIPKNHSGSYGGDRMPVILLQLVADIILAPATTSSK